MPRILFVCLLVSAGVARASVTEPNGLQVPASVSNGQVTLPELFSSQGDPVDWQADAATTPSTFTPLCGVTVKLVLREGGTTPALAWYNARGMLPSPSDLHEIVPAAAPVGASVTVDIRNDPAYAGGLIGFALVGGQTHYSEQAWHPLCTACAPPGPWLLSLVYLSKSTPDAVYLAFEEGAAGATPGAFNNDGDFNDSVFLISRVTCSGAHQPCSTGKSGICDQGLTVCTRNGVVCQQVAAPVEESCDGLDNDCNGFADDGASCAAGKVCVRGGCVPSCEESGHECFDGQQCVNGRCVDAACATRTCPVGQVCAQGKCRAPCTGVTCPFGLVCRADRCVEPCDGVQCGAGEVCSNGVCHMSCKCAGCTSGLACVASGQCVDPACVDTQQTCGTGEHCSQGTCVDSCEGATCPVGETCASGVCRAPVPDAGPGDAGSGDAGSQDAGSGDAGPEDAGRDAGVADAGQVIDAGPDGGQGTVDAGPGPGSSGGCGCGSTVFEAGWGVLLWLGWSVSRRRR